MNNEILKLLEDCKDALKLSDDVLHEFLIMEIDRAIKNEDKEYEEYNPSFAQVMKFYRETTFEQHRDFLTLIHDRLTFFDVNSKKSYEIDDEYVISTNGIFHQINIK